MLYCGEMRSSTLSLLTPKMTPRFSYPSGRLRSSRRWPLTRSLPPKAVAFLLCKVKQGTRKASRKDLCRCFFLIPQLI